MKTSYVKSLALLIVMQFYASCSTEEATTSVSSTICGFERPPFIIRANFMNGASIDAELLLIGLHAKPDNAFYELNMLDNVAEEASSAEGVTNLVALGDFNASCSYLSNTEQETLDLTLKNWSWLIPNSADTNVSSSQCAYDRILNYGSLVSTSAGVITSSFGSSISDHYPVYSILRVNGRDYKVSAFNLERFGSTKAADANFVTTVKNYIASQDIVLLQEITTEDSTLLNNLIPAGYSYVVSSRLGTTTYKEQYAYVYNSKVNITKDYVYSGTLCVSTTKATPTSGSTGGGTSPQCTSDGYYCGLDLYIINGQCRARNKNGVNSRVRDCCCGF